MQTLTIDQQKVDQFGARMLDMLNMGSLGLMVSVGHRTGLFDAMADMEPATSHAIAERDLEDVEERTPTHVDHEPLSEGFVHEFVTDFEYMTHGVCPPLSIAARA